MLRTAIIIFLLGCIFICRPHYAFSQNTLNFYDLTEKDGLSYNIVNCFFKDSRGILWVGTYNGLNRYDGSHFYIFKKTKDVQSLPDNTVHKVCEDKNGDIWGITDNGIFKYNIKEATFKNYFSSAENKRLAGYNILCDVKGDIYADITNDLIKYNPSKDSFEALKKFSADTVVRKIWSIQKNGMAPDPSGKGIWLATMWGLNYYDCEKRKLYNYLDFPGSPLFKNSLVSALAEGKDNKLWYFDYAAQSIIQFDPALKTITRTISIKNLLPQYAGATIFEDDNHILWFCSWSFDIFTIDYLHDKITLVKHNDNDPLSITGDFFWAAMQDADSTVWLGTAGGIARCNPSKTFYKIHRLPEKIPFLQTHAIGNIAESPYDKSLWLITGGSKVINYFPATGEYKMYDVSKALPGLGDVYPAVLFIRFVNGMVILNTTTGPWGWTAKEPYFKPVSLLPAAWRSFKVTDVIQQNDSIYYFTDGTQLLVWNSRSQKATATDYVSFSGIKNSAVYVMLSRPGKKPWLLSTTGWLATLNDNDKPEMVKLRFDENNEAVPSYITSADFDNNGNIWLSKKGYGLYAYNPSTKITQSWRESDGLVFDHIMTATPDNLGQVWCAAYNKISVYAPAAKNFYNFSFPVSTNNYGYVNQQILLSNGNILVTMMGDLVEFFPERLVIKPSVSKPVISLVNINGHDSLLNGDTVLHLEPDENSVTLKFGLLTDAEIFRYSFRYMLEGADKTWINAGDRYEAVYRNLPPGTYTFRLIADGTNKTWASPEAMLTLIIRTPFYKATWFWIIIGLLLAALLYLFYRNRIMQARQMHSLETKAQLLEKEKALVMYEGLKQQLNPHFLFNSLTSLSSLISSDKNVAKDFLDSLSKTYRYILKSRDSEVVPLADETKFAQNYVKLQQTRFEKGLIVNFNIDEDYAYRKIVPVTMQNMIENAIKHNIIDEETPLVIDIYTQADHLIIMNNLQKKNFVETSNRQGLTNLQTLYHYLTQSPVEIIEDEKFFTVKIPLL